MWTDAGGYTLFHFNEPHRLETQHGGQRWDSLQEDILILI